MELKAIRHETDGHVATVWLDRPHRHNAWTGRMHTELRWVMAELENRVRAVVITGTPPAFCVGGDSEALAGHADRGTYDAGLPPEPARPGVNVRPELDEDFAWMFAYRVPIIAAVNGAAAGVGLALALFSDLRFGAAPAKLTTAAPRLGLPAEYGMSWVLPRLCGVTRAADLLLSGRTVTVADTADWGLWNGVFDDGEQTLAEALRYADLVASSAGPAAVTTTKQQLYADLLRHDVAASVSDSKRLLVEAMGTAEYREGVAALRERRAPHF
ncbi:MAG: enoyl-CoA hydratase-related protein [Ilumatobacter sp.]|uniref:enoyl-CoA hydratase-related protein n=1 Tax=Ilumatobacter sp. TaxID=1967498 RepID=UPI00262074E7|nr:enoyl-CoA hydratase-related protein [Ilumatobacter sp.]MDJ0768614.1 enoyl-CoA hydratase-related protein [Ilumatobacter sp.]